MRGRERPAPRRGEAPVGDLRRLRPPTSALALALLLGACAGAPGPGPLPPSPAAPSAPQARPEAPRGWSTLPPEARAAAEAFRARVSAGDWAWVAARADPGFRRAYPGGGPGDGAYLARLLRSGELARGEPAEGRGFSPLDPRGIAGLRWEEARLEGPVALLFGSFLHRGGRETPFALHLLWRAEPPQILGLGP